MKESSLKLRLSTLYFVVCGALACYYPFMYMYYKSNNLNYSQIGVLFGINSLIAVIAQPVWGFITDRYLNMKRSFLLVLIMSSILIFGFMLAKSYVFILIWVIVFMVFQSSILSINDAFCYEVIDAYKSLQYGKFRLMGSIGYAVVALVMAYLIKWTNINSSFLVYAILGVLGVLVLRGINVKSISVRSGISFNDVFLIIKNKKFIILVISAMLVSSSMSSNSNYLATLIEKTGGGVSSIGYLWFIVAMSELPAFYFGSRLINRFGVLNMYLVGLLFYAARFFLDSLSTSYQVVIAVQLLQSITYPLYIMTTLQCVNDIVPAKARTTAITVFAALSAGVGGFIGNIAAGQIVDNFNVFVLFRVMSLLCVISFLIGLWFKKQKQ